jgi:hypothetical protein
MIKPKDVALSIDKQVDALVQAHRVSSAMDVILVDYWKMLRHQPIEEGGVFRYRFYFTGDMVTGLQQKLEELYLPLNWSAVRVQGWELKNFLQMKNIKAPEIIDIGGNPSRVFEVELSNMGVWM